MIVLDASILVKLFKDEDDSGTARKLVTNLVEKNAASLVPTLALYEALSAALHVGYPFEQVSELFARLRQFGLSAEEPTKDELALAEKIATTKAPGGGYPTLFDSIYHAMAITRRGTFVTADARHMSKAGHFGSVSLLSQWTAI